MSLTLVWATAILGMTFPTDELQLIATLVCYAPGGLVAGYLVSRRTRPKATYRYALVAFKLWSYCALADLLANVASYIFFKSGIGIGSVLGEFVGLPTGIILGILLRLIAYE